MNVNLTKADFLELLTVYIVEEAKATGKDFIGGNPNELSEYDLLLAHIAKFPMKTQLRMSRYSVSAPIKASGRRFADAMSRADKVRIMV